MTYITKFCEWDYGDGVKCSNPLTERAYNYSLDHYNKALCFGHQRQFGNKLKSAKDYVNFNVKEGLWSLEEWENLSDEEFINRAEYEMERSDFYAT